MSRRSPFKRHRFPPEIILLAVRWYCRYTLSYRDVRDMLSERGIEVDGSTIYRSLSGMCNMPCRSMGL